MTTHVLARHGLIRGPRKADQSFIASTWVRNMAGVASRAYGSHGGAIARDIDVILDRDDTRALVRHEPNDPDRIVGWVVYVEGPKVPVLHYAYVRHQHRGRGIAKALLASIGVTKSTPLVYTHRGPDTRLMCVAYPLATYLSVKEFLAS